MVKLDTQRLKIDTADNQYNIQQTLKFSAVQKLDFLETLER